MPDPDELSALYRSLQDTRYVEESPARRRSFEHLASVIDAAHPTRGKLLDVGCSSGFFLEAAAARGWDVQGIEPSSWLASRAQQTFGDRVIASTLEDAPLTARNFDVVTIWDVVEHVINPAAFLRRAADLVKPGGLLAINVPNRASMLARILGRRWPLRLPEHLYYFSPPSLRRLSRAAGLEGVRFKLHPVYFSLPYIRERLAQHGIPCPGALGKLNVVVPIVMGELTVLANKPR